MIAWTVVETSIGRLWLAATAAGLCRLGLPNEGQTEFLAALGRVEAGGTLREDPAPLVAAQAQLDEYLAGQRRSFDLPLDLHGTDFQRAVWRELMNIPYGTTLTYGELTRRLGRSAGAARAVGAAVGANPLSIVIPCHRVLGSNGSLTGYGGGLPLKVKLLQLEGVILPAS